MIEGGITDCAGYCRGRPFDGLEIEFDEIRDIEPVVPGGLSAAVDIKIRLVQHGPLVSSAAFRFIVTFSLILLLE